MNDSETLDVVLGFLAHALGMGGDGELVHVSPQEITEAAVEAIRRDRAQNELEPLEYR